MADVFISYAREDRSRAEHVARGLEAAGLTAFWDTDIPPGQTWADYIEAKLSACKTVIVLWSEHSTKSQWVREEARMGRDKAKLIPVMIDASQPPFGFGEVQAADLSHWNGDYQQPQWTRLVQAVRSAAGVVAPQTPQVPPQPQSGWSAPPQPAASAWRGPTAPSAAAALSPLDHIKTCLRFYAVGAGRARRAELGWFSLFVFGVLFVAAVFDTLMFGIDPYTGAANMYLFTALAGLGLAAPVVSAASRRAHDFGQSGWLAILTVIPYLGWLALLVFIFIPGQPGANPHGADPKALQAV